MKYGVTLGTTGYIRHMTNSLLTVTRDEQGRQVFTHELLFEGVPVKYIYENMDIDRVPEDMKPEDWDKLHFEFDRQVSDHVHRLLAQEYNESIECEP